MNLPNGNNENQQRVRVIDHPKINPEKLKALPETKPDLENVIRSAIEDDPTLIERWEAQATPSNLSVITQSQSLKRWEQENNSGQSSVRYKTIILTMVGIAIVGIGWTVLTQIDTTIEQVISATGQLKTQKTVREIQAPSDRVVREIYVKNGDYVEKGQPLVRFDAKNAYEQLQFLENSRQFLLQQNRFYQTTIEGLVDKAQVETKIVLLKLSREAAVLLRNRLALLEANRLLQIQLKTAQTNLNKHDQPLASQAEHLSSKPPIAHVNLAVEQLQKRLKQNQVQQQTAQRNLSLEQTNLAKLQLLVREGAISRFEYMQQQQKVQFQEAEVERLRLEQQQLKLSIAQINEQLIHLTTGDNQQKVLVPNPSAQKQMADNQKQIAEIDSQLAKMIAENERKIVSFEHKISQIKQISKSSTLFAPVTGTVFNLQITPGVQSKSLSTKTLLKLMTDERDLIAEALIPKKNIDYIWKGMKVNVNINSLPLNKYGAIKGTLIAIDSDVLPPNQVHPFYRLPSQVSLEQQTLVINNKKISLQPGMPVIINIKVREKRTLLEAILQQIGLGKTAS